MRLIENQAVERAILGHLSLWEEPRPPPVTTGTASRAPAELEYLLGVEQSSPGGGAAV